MQDLLKKAYDPEIFRREGHHLIDFLADYLKLMQMPSKDQKVLDWAEPDELVDKWKKDLSSSPNKDIQSFFQQVTDELIHIHHPQYLGHQVSAAMPLMSLGALLGNVLDTGMGIYEQGTVGVAMEKIIIEVLAKKMGIDHEHSAGFLTNGGTLGNLTALLCARAKMIEREVWQHGFEGKKYAFLVSEEAHYSIDRAVRVMGMGEHGIVKVPANARYQMDPHQLEAIYQEQLAQGVQVIGVVASSCATAVGAHDDLHAIADFCERHQLWMHVDAAHGGCLLFSKSHRHHLDGIERADSMIMDFHKMLGSPTLITAVVFKDGNDSYRTFSQKADYLWADSEKQEWYNLAKRTFELTKTSMAFRIFLALRTYGESLFEQHVDYCYNLGQTFAKLLADAGFDMPIEVPESNIVCYRLHDSKLSEEENDLWNSKIRDFILKEGKFYIVQTRVKGRVFLRSTLVNPATTEVHLNALIEHIKMIAPSLHPSV